MKKLLFIGLILAICILAFPQGVLAANFGAAGGPVAIDATYGEGVGTTFTADLVKDSGVWSWDLVAGSYTEKDPAIHFVVTSLAKWEVTASDTGAGTKGYLHGDQGDLINPYEMSLYKKTSWSQLTGDDPKVNDGAASTSPQPWDEKLRQYVETNDLGSATGYHTEITFTCTAPF